MKKNNKMPEVDIELLRKFFQKRCDQGEKELIRSWFSDLRYEGKLKNLVGEHWEEIALESPDYDLDTDRLLDKLHHEIHLDAYKKSLNVPFYSKVYRQLSRIAAILLLPLLVISSLYFLSGGRFVAKGEKSIYAEIHSPLAARTRFELPDGSTGWLNSGSSLKFPVKFSGTQRKVELSGEGFFDVATDSNRPFVVNASDINVMALGTRFNVLAYPDDEAFEVTLESGKVVVEKTREHGEPVKLAELKPDHQLAISTITGNVNVKKVMPAKYTSWKEGKLVFRNDPMYNVVKRISRWYNVEINLKDKEMESYTFRATFENEAFSEVLKLLKASSPIDYVEHEREMLSDGTFTKRRVTLFLKPGKK
ncbi:MAG: FecR domain-containing protein [Bacteroidota bacterium]